MVGRLTERFAMHRTEKVARLKAMLRQIEPETDWK